MRSREQRVQDTLEKLRSEVDLWIATADQEGDPYLVPLSFYWSGEVAVVSTPRSSRTGRNFLRTGRTRAAIGPTRDVVVDARVEEMPIGEDVELEDGFVRATDFDPRPWDAAYTFFRLVPERIQAWLGDDAGELRDKDVMRVSTTHGNHSERHSE